MAMSRRRRFFWIAVGLVLVASFTAVVLGGLAYFVQQQGISSTARKSDARSHVLSVTLDGSFAENPAPSFQLSFSGNPPPTFPAIIRALDRAANEPNLTTVFVRIGATDLGWGRAGEVRQATSWAAGVVTPAAAMASMKTPVSCRSVIPGTRAASVAARARSATSRRKA